MKVTCYISKIVKEDIEIDDKFAILAHPRPWELNLPKELYAEAINAVEEAIGYYMDDSYDNYVISVEETGTGEIMLEL